MAWTSSGTYWNKNSGLGFISYNSISDNENTLVLYKTNKKEETVVIKAKCIYIYRDEEKRERERK